MSGQQLSVGLLFVGVIALGATAYLGSPWPGVALCALSLVPWATEAWLGRVCSEDSDDRDFERRRVDGLVTLANETHKAAMAAHARIEEQEKQINSLRSTVSLRGTLGG